MTAATATFGQPSSVGCALIQHGFVDGVTLALAASIQLEADARKKRGSSHATQI